MKLGLREQSLAPTDALPALVPPTRGPATALIQRLADNPQSATTASEVSLATHTGLVCIPTGHPADVSAPTDLAFRFE